MNEEEIFHQALARSRPEERAAYLEQACAGDPALRAGVEALLRANVGASGFLGQPAPALVATVDEPSRSECPGTVIGPYKLLQQIGEGGMGTVFMAEQTHPVQRKVALKVIKAGMDSRQVIARFEAERQALAMMDHVNIARVLDAGATEAGRPYFVMELVHGVPITKYCDDNHLTPRQRLELFVPVCQAIQHAHQKGIIHRDIKPSNVMVTLYDGKPVPKVIDFGVAKATEQKLTERTLFTQYGTMVGTLEYMSPEQAEMSALGVDTRSDIYSLGVLLYELLTGSTPLTHKRMKEAAYAEILRMIKEEEPPKPSTRLSDSGEALASISANRHTEPAKLTKLVRGELDWIVMKTLEKDRNRRYETANGFAADVQRYLNDEPVQACPASAGYRLRKFMRRNKRALVTAALLGVMLVAVLGTVAGSIGWAARDRSARQAILNREVDLALNEASTTRDRALTLTDNPSQWEATLAAALSALKRAEALDAQEGAALDRVLQDRLRTLRTTLDADENDRRFAARLDEIRLEQSEVDVENNFFKSLEAFPKIKDAFKGFYGIEVGVTPPDQVVSFIQQRPKSVQQYLLVALDISLSYTPHQDAQSRQWTTAVLAADTAPWRNRANKAVAARDWAAVEELIKEASTARRAAASLILLARILPKEAADARLNVLRQIQQAYPGDFWANADLAFALTDSELPQAEEAVRFWTAALALRPDNPGVYLNLSLALQRKGDVEGAITAYRQAIRLRPDYVQAYIGLGSQLCDKKGDYDGAIAASKEAIRLKPDLAEAYNNLGIALSRKGDHDGAIVAYKDAIRLKPDFANAHFRLGDILKQKGRLDEAIAAYREAIRRRKDYAEVHNNLGLALNDKGQLDEAIAAYREAIRLNKDLAPPHLNLGNALMKKGLPDEAIVEYREAIHLQKGYATAHGNLGRALLLQKGRTDEAIAELREAIRLNKDFLEAHLNLGNGLKQKGQLDEAIVEYRETVRLDKNSPELRLNLARALSKNGLRDEAIAECRQALRLKPDYLNAWNFLGDTLKANGQLDEAIVEYREAIRLNKNLPRLHIILPRLHILLATALKDKGRLDEAIAECREAIRLEPNYYVGHRTLGDALLAKGRLNEALAAYRQALALYPKDDRVRSRLGVDLRALSSALWYKQDWDGAINASRAAIALAPNDSAAFMGLAHALWGKKDWEGAAAAYAEVIRLQPKDAYAHTSLAMLMALSPGQKFRDLKRMVELAEKAVELQPKNATYWGTLGLARYEAGDWKGAIAAAQQSMKFRPIDDPTRDHMADLTRTLNLFVFAMAHWRLEDKEQARKWYDQAIRWMEKTKLNDPDLPRLRSQAAELLEVSKK